MNGVFITFEGIDGSGKTTQAKILRDHLLKLEYNIMHTREPGGTSGAAAIRDLVCHNDYIFSPHASCLLFLSAMADNVEKNILPSLKKGYVVICDRYLDSTLAYHSSKTSPYHELLAMGAYATQALVPDLTFLLDVPVDKAMQRCSDRGELLPFDECTYSNMRDVQERYGIMQLANQNRTTLINGDQSIDKVAADIMMIVYPYLKRHYKENKE